MFLKYLMKHRDEAIGAFIINNKKYGLYVSEYAWNNGESYKRNLEDLLNTSIETKRWKKAFIGEDTSHY